VKEGKLLAYRSDEENKEFWECPKISLQEPF